MIKTVGVKLTINTSNSSFYTDKVYTFKTFEELHLGDIVVVPYPQKGYFGTAKVTRIDQEPQEATKFIVSKVNTVMYDEIVRIKEEEEELLRQLEELEEGFNKMEIYEFMARTSIIAENLYNKLLKCKEKLDALNNEVYSEPETPQVDYRQEQQEDFDKDDLSNIFMKVDKLEGMDTIIEKQPGPMSSGEILREFDKKCSNQDPNCTGCDYENSNDCKKSFMRDKLQSIIKDSREGRASAYKKKWDDSNAN